MIRTSPPLSRTLFTAVTLCVFSLTVAFHARAQNDAQPHRLILKDGSYQLVTKYEVKGDRVRYLSSERDEWEELPSSLVDWPATEKFEKERTAPPAIPDAALIDKETEADREADLAHLPQVAPGLRLPEDSGVYLLDTFKGEPQIDEMQQAEGDINPNTRANLIRGALIPIAGAKQIIELDGEHAILKSHVAIPSIYINLEDDPSLNQPPPGETASAKPSAPSLDAPRAEPQKPQQPQQPVQPTVPFDRFRIVRVQVKGGKRIVGDFKRSATGKITQEQSSVKTTIDKVSGGWLKLTPIEPLTSGEYAVIETKGKDGMNLYVWDFAVNLNAPPNANPWKPDAESDTKPEAAQKAKENNN
jgi:hypothetical protein